ncbi:nucleoporin NUP42-like [Paramacrobiotus metropolitanus]|uniref:nucleoporin NUP42-like n=1 Tax=Paramacrobiotus metropolitanus TaxID=2943436 RepID=UPI0024465ADA|nr:nucleoporin NUP42-like [Paramacrobiotus metropolitanus]
MANVVCRFFLEGRCKYGDRCHNQHPADAAYEEYYEDDSYQNAQYYPRGGYSGHRGGGYRPRYPQNHSRYSGPRSSSSWEPRPASGGFHGSPHFTSPSRFEPPGRFPSPAAAQSVRPSSDLEVLNDVLLDATNMLHQTARSDLVFQVRKIWPFTAYTYRSPEGQIQTDPLFGLEDYSPEELRAMAYVVRDDASQLSEYVNGVVRQSNSVRNILSEVCKACSNPNSNEAKAVISEIHAKAAQNKVRQETPSPVLQFQGATSAPIQNMGEQRPHDQSVAQAPPSGIYSDTSMLTAEDFYQFASAEFTQGKVPYLPPPKNLC